MLNQEDIPRLGQRAWYRTVKVLYVLVVTGALVFGFVGLYEENIPAQKVLDREHSTLTCKGGKTYPLSETSLVLSVSDFDSSGRLQTERRDSLYSGINTWENIRSLCNIPPKKSGYIPLAERGLWEPTLALEESKKNEFDIVPAFKYEGGLVVFLTNYFLWVALVLFLAEIVRRVFFYILLGKNPIYLPKLRFGLFKTIDWLKYLSLTKKQKNSIPMTEQPKVKSTKFWSPALIGLLCLGLFDLATKTLVQEQTGIPNIGYVSMGVLLLFKYLFGTSVAVISSVVSSMVLGLIPMVLLVGWGIENWTKSKKARPSNEEKEKKSKTLTWIAVGVAASLVIVAIFLAGASSEEVDLTSVPELQAIKEEQSRKIMQIDWAQ